jgi:hypothetical protein
MGKLILALIVALALGLTFPESRAVILDRSQPLLNPAYHWLTAQEMNQIVEDLEFLGQSQGRLPTARGEFDAWLDRRYPQERSRYDAWGERYRLQVTGDRFIVVSAGPDGQFGTDDDITREGQRSGRR